MAKTDNVALIIAGVSPDKYTKRDSDAGSINLSGFKKALREDFFGALKNISKDFNLKPSSAEEHKLVYDSTSETLEPLYFWILDFTGAQFDVVEKLVDNFTSSPGSGHFGEIGMRATRMQEEGMKIMGAVNTVLKSIMNLIYDLKEFQIRLSHYAACHSKNKDEAEAGILSLKQIWMDNVDIKRGRGSINMLAQDMQFVTLRDAFMSADSVEQVEKMDLNDRVKRMLKPRLHEFFEWQKRSETELKKRYAIEKNYLKSQVSSLKLYTRWAKPYLVAAEQLRNQEGGRNPALVNVFNTLVLQLTLLGKRKIKVEDIAIDKDIPEEFRKLKMKRQYYKCVLIDFVFRGIPQRISAQQQHYVFGGRAEVTFKAYCLNDDEIALLDDKLGESDIADALNLVNDATSGSLDELREDIDSFLKEEEKEEEEHEKKADEDVNPFAALFGIGKGGKKKTKGMTEEEKKKEEKKKKLEELKEKGVKKDSYAESVIRNLGENESAQTCFNIFDVYKKAHGMESHPEPFWDEFQK